VELLIDGRDLRHAYGALQAVDGVDLRVAAGEIVALLGPDGAGKTTLMRLVCGALRLQTGEIRLCGIDLRAHPDQARANLGYLPSQFSLYQELTVLENLRFFAEVPACQPVNGHRGRWRSSTSVGLGRVCRSGGRRALGRHAPEAGPGGGAVHRPRCF